MSSYRSIRYFDGQLLRIRGVKSTELGMAVKLAIFEVPGVLLLMGHMQKVYILLHSITILLTLAPEEVVGGPLLLPPTQPELSLVYSRRNMTEWSASEPRHWAVNLMLSPNYNINLQLSHLHTSIHSNYPSWKIGLTR